MMITFYHKSTNMTLHVIGVTCCCFETITPRDPAVMIHELHVGDCVWMCRREIRGTGKMDLMFAVPATDWEMLYVNESDFDWIDNTLKVTMSDAGIEVSPDLKPAERRIPDIDWKPQDADHTIT